MDRQNFSQGMEAVNGPPHAAAKTDIKRFVHNRAVVIGIDHYQSIRPLRTAVNDARRLAAFLREQLGYDDVVLLEDASLGMLTTELGERLAERVGSGDRLLLYFAGHGIALDGDDGPEGYLVPVDASVDDASTFVAMAALYSWLEALPCRHLLVMLDCCFAGAFTWYGGRSVRPIGAKLYREHYDRFVREPAWQIITSAAHDQEALDVIAGKAIGVRGEYTNAGTQHSPFAEALFAALQGEGDLIPKGQGDGVVTATELYLYLRQTVEVGAEAHAKHRQTPELWPLSRARHGKGEYIFLVPGHGDPDLPPAPELTFENNPYRGLQSYDEQHAALFFGRYALIEKLAAAVDQHPLTVVLGASGTGKSSVVKAGVVPYLRTREEEISGEDTEMHNNELPLYTILPPMRPADEPLRMLEQLVAVNLPGRFQPGASIASIIQGWLVEHPDRRLLLVVDQAEELVTLCRDEARRAFLQVLADLVSAHPDRLHTVLTLRTDFEPQFENSPLNGFWRDGRFVVPPMSWGDLREVIEGPASVSVLFFDPPELVETLIDEVIQTPGALPLLSFTLEQLYLKYLDRQSRAQRDGVTLERALTQADYEELGGVIGSLRRRADDEYTGLHDDTYRVTMQRVMLRMVAVEGGEVTRRRVLTSELKYPTEQENERVQAVLDRLVSARLLITGSVDVDGDGVEDTVFEPAHDALVAAWNKLLQWKQQAEEYLPLQRRLWQAASEWDIAPQERKRGLLWDANPRLPQLEETLWPTRSKEGGLAGRVRWARQVLWPKTDMPDNTQWLNLAEVAFVQASVRQRAVGLRRLIGGVCAFIFLLVIATLVSTYFADIAIKNEKEAVEQQQIADEQRQIAVEQQQIAVEQRNEALRQARLSKAEQLTAYARSRLAEQGYADEMTLLLIRDAITTTLKDDGFVTPNTSEVMFDALDYARRWQTDLPPVHHDSDINSVEFSPDGEHFVSASSDGTGIIWNSATAGDEHILSGHQDRVNVARFSPDGQYVATASADGTARVWSAMTGQEVQKLVTHKDDVVDVTWSPDKKRLVTAGSDGILALWNVENWQMEKLLVDGAEAISAAAWNPDAQRIAYATKDGSIKLLNVNAGRVQFTIPGRGQAHTSMVWNTTGSKLAIARPNLLQTYDASSGANLLSIPVSGTINAITFSPDATRIATASSNEIQIWDADGGELLRSIEGAHSHRALAVYWSADGNKIVSVGDDSNVKIWDLAAGRASFDIVNRHGSQILAAAWNPQGGMVATADTDGRLQVWEPASGKLLQSIQAGVDLRSISWDPTGTLLATAGQGNRIEVWDVHTGHLSKYLYRKCEESVLGLSSLSKGEACDIYALAWSPDGKLLAAVGGRSNINIIDVSSSREVMQVARYGGPIFSVAWDPTGKRVLISGSGKLARILDANSGKEELELSGHSDVVWSARWDATGDRVVTASWDKTAKVWDARTGELLFTLDGHNDIVLSAEWNPRGSRIMTTGWDGKVMVWDATSRQILYSLFLTGPTANLLRSRPFEDFLPSSRPVENLWSASWSPDGRYMVSISGEPYAKIWRSSNGRQQVSLSGHTGPVTSISWSPNDSFLASASVDKSVRVWDLKSATGTVLRGHQLPVRSVAWSPAGDRIVSTGTDGHARIWARGFGDEGTTFSEETAFPITFWYGDVYTTQADWNSTGRQVVTTAYANVGIWDADTGEKLQSIQFTDDEIFSDSDRILDVDFSPDGRLVLAAGWGGTVRVWDVDARNTKYTRADHAGAVNSARWSHAGDRFITASEDGTARIWNAENGAVLQVLIGHLGPLNYAEWSSDDRYIVTASDDDTAKIWLSDSGAQLFTLSGHLDDVNQASWSHDGNRIATASNDGTIRIWWASSEKWLALLQSKVQRNARVLLDDERWKYGYQ